MIRSRFALFGLCLGTVISIAPRSSAQGPGEPPRQDDPTVAKPKVIRPTKADANLQSIHEDYARQLLDLERQRLERIAKLAARQSPGEALETYRELFHLAVANNLFREAEPAAREVLKTTSPLPPVIVFLARTIDIVASADRGAYDESLSELHAFLQADSKRAHAKEPAGPSLDASALLAICDAYYQRLLHGGRFDVARTAFQMILDEAEVPAAKRFASDRLNQLNMIGKLAPGIEGTDLDGRPVSLSGLKGDVVLVVFWASWCLPSADEVAAVDVVFDKYKNRGFRILGINVDTLQGEGPKLESVLPNVRRFLLDNNVRWPNLINGTGATDYAKAYAIVDIPSNVLIGRDGTVIHRDLSPRKNLATVVAKAVAP
jgi:thiol-disulfide isomerase/thioredoxin